MNIFFQFLQQNRLFVHFLTIFVVLVGAFQLFHWKKEARPNVNFNRMAISAIYPGASPSDVEELVSVPIEEKLAEIEGIEEYRSVSFQGASEFSVKLQSDLSDPQRVMDEIRRKVGEVRDLPAEVETPKVEEIKTTTIPVLKFALTSTTLGDSALKTLREEGTKIKDFFMLQEGVQSVSLTGVGELEMLISADPKKLKYTDTTLTDVITSVNTWAKQRPAGLWEKNQTYSLNLSKTIQNPEELSQFVIRSNDQENKITLNDVSNINLGTESITNENLFDGKQAMLITVNKKESEDIVRVVDRLTMAYGEYQKNLPQGLTLSLYQDEAVRVKNRLSIVINNAISGLVLVLAILFIFLSLRSALLTIFGIPIAFLGGVLLVAALGNTLNSLVIVGIIIVLGMLVDDAIVVCENIYGYIEKQKTPVEAAVLGVSEIAVPVMASVLTTIFAFLPIVFMQEIIGQFLRVIPLTVCAMLICSLLEALIILPVHAGEVFSTAKLKPKKVKFMVSLENAYRRYLAWSYPKRRYLNIVLIVFLLASFFQGRLLFKRFSLFPAEGLDGLSVRIETKVNTPKDVLREISNQLSSEFKNIEKSYIEGITTTLGQVSTGGFSGARQKGSHFATINVGFFAAPELFQEEKRVLAQITSSIQKTEKRYEAYQAKITLTLNRPGPPTGKPVQIQVTSRDFKKSFEVVGKLTSFLKEIPGVHSIENDFDAGSKSYRFMVDKVLATSDGVNPAMIAQTLFAATSNVKITEILRDGTRYTLSVGMDNASFQDPKDLLKLEVRNTRGETIPLSSWTTYVEEFGASSIQRLNGARTITLFGEVFDKQITGAQVFTQLKPLLAELKNSYPDVRLDIGGGEKDRMRAVSDTLNLYWFALIAIYMVIALSFNSLLYPFFVLFSIPLGIAGVVWALILHQKGLTLMGLIGVVGLSGVVVNTTILLLSMIKSQLEAGVSLEEAITAACTRRLRPIIMTTTTTLLGLIPTIYGMGGIDTFVQPIALVLAYGLLIATVLTLFFLPALWRSTLRYAVPNADS